MSIMAKFFNDILTCKDNSSFDQGRVMSFISFLSYLAYGAASLVLNHPWAPLDFAGGLSAMAVGFGIHQKLKQDTEPGS